MEQKKVKLDAGLLAGILMALLTLRALMNFVRILRFQFSFPALIGAAALGFVAAMVLMKRRDKLLLIALGVLAVDHMIWSNIVSFVAIAILLALALVMTTEYLPQAKALAEKIWFVPAILAFISSFIGIYRFSFMTIVWALVSCAAMLLLGYWLVFPERDLAALFAAAGSKEKPVAPIGEKSAATVTAAEVDGYCELFKHVLLLLLTFGIWYLIWIYRMTRYLNRVGGEEPRNPVTKLLLCIFVPFYLIYWTYKSAQRIDKMADAVGVSSHISTLCLILSLFLPVVAPVLMQDKVNTVIAVENGSRARDFDPEQKTVRVLTAAPEAMPGYCGLFKHVLLMMLTFGIWNFIWIYRTTEYLNRVEGEEKRNPVTKLLLCMFVPFYMVYWIYKSCQRIDKLGAQVGVRSDLTVLCLVLCLVVGLVPQVLMQDKINEIAFAENYFEEIAAQVQEASAEVDAEEEDVENDYE